MDVVVSNSSTAMALASPFSFPLEQDFVGANGISTTSTGNVAFQGYNETSATKGVLEYRTYYNLITNNGTAVSKINKPIIILDGYDPGDGRKIYQYSAGYNSTKSSLYELMYYDHDNNTATDKISLVEKLRSAPYGFDVTLVNFPNGADYVERNAMALVSLLSRENAKLATNGSTEKISIIGPSMGGLVSRYALAYMEKNGINHNTKLWVSFDSPHLGANIPIGAQENLYFYGYKGRQDQAKLKFDENFRSPAARQMLIEQLDGKHEASPYPTDLWSNTAPNGQNNNSPFRQQFQNNLNSNGLAGSNGYPQNLRKIALINGTTNGTKTNGEGNMFLELAAFTIIKYGQIFGTSIQTKLKVATIEDKFLSTPYSSSQTFAGKVTIKRVGGIEVQKGRVIRTNSNSRGSMDNVQGGTFNTQGIIKDEFTLALNDAVDSQEWRAYIPNHAFIPSVSSLAFKNPNFDWSTALNRNLVCDPNNKEIYFDSYFSPSKNEEHVFVSAENANWLIKELQGIPQAPSFPLDQTVLTGPDVICNRLNTNYTIQDICKLPNLPIYTNQNGNVINGWSVTPNLTIINTSNNNIVVVANSIGDAEITLTFQNGLKITKKIKLYYIPTQPIPSGQVYVDDSNLDCYHDSAIPVFFDPSNNYGGIITYSPKILPHPLKTQTRNVTVKYTNPCTGEFTSNIFTLYHQGPDCINNRISTNTNFYTIYPNPSNDIVNIEIRDANNIPEKRATITGELFDMMRQLKAKVEINNNKATFSVSGLNKGIYVLKIYINDKVESHQIAVE